MLAVLMMLAGDWQIPRPHRFGFVNPNRAVLKALMLLAALVARGFNDARGGLANPPPHRVRIYQSEPSGFKGFDAARGPGCSRF
ncbi:hypothetical protein QUF80_06135 [Desulfococcaceae bacterium HSG8]|nr:hypothetical protein [Desulfococcaceae bacterium HSG8]